MLKQTLVLILSAGLMMSTSGCTSKKAAEEEATADVAEVAGEGEGGEDVAASTESADELGSDELSADEKLPEEGGAAEAPPTDVAQEGGDDFSAPTDEMSGAPDQGSESPSGDMAANEPPKEEVMEPAPEPTTPEPSADGGTGGIEESLAAGDTTPPPMSDEAPKPPPASLRKIADTPYQSGKIWVNAVYLARPNDTLDSISTKIYGSNDKVKELVRINPTFKSREVKVGDKVYYNSPSRPTDDSKLLVYYEDIGLAPEIYVVTKPENIRKVAKNLFGDTNSWKELWSTNLDPDLSKGELPEGTQLRYWAGAPATAVAAAPPPTEAPPAETPPSMDAAATSAPPPPVDQQVPPPPPPPDMAQTEMPPPPPVEAQAPPPPPPPAEMPPPPPPPQETAASEAPTEPAGPLAALGIEGKDETMVMGAGAVFMLGLVLLFVMMRKRRSRRNLDFHTSTQTQIE